MASNDSSTLVELYKLAVEMADRMSARRAGANSFFLTVNTTLVAVVGIVGLVRRPPPHSKMPSFDPFGLCIIAVAGIVLAWVWWLLLRYYRRLNSVKFQVINKMEKRLPAQVFTDEWAILHPEPKPDGHHSRPWAHWWHREMKHREASVVEQVVPFVFMFIYLVLGLRVLVQ